MVAERKLHKNRSSLVPSLLIAATLGAGAGMTCSVFSCVATCHSSSGVFLQFLSPVELDLTCKKQALFLCQQLLDPGFYFIPLGIVSGLFAALAFRAYPNKARMFYKVLKVSSVVVCVLFTVSGLIVLAFLMALRCVGEPLRLAL